MRLSIATFVLATEVLLIAFDRFRPAVICVTILFLVVQLRCVKGARIRVPMAMKIVVLLASLILCIGLGSSVHMNGTLLPSALKACLRYTSPLLVALIFYNSGMEQRTYRLVIAWLCIISFLVFGIQWALGVYRPPSFFEHKNPYAYFLIAANLTLVPQILVGQRRLSSMIVLIVSPFVLILSDSLGGVICYAVAVFSMAWIRSNVRRRLALALLVPLAAGAIFIVKADRFSKLRDIQEITTRIEENDSGGGSSLLWRIVTWYRFAHVTMERGRLMLGNGLDSTSRVAPDFLLEEHQRNDPHNDYIRIFTETGVFGLALFLFLLTALWRQINFLKCSTTECNRVGKVELLGLEVTMVTFTIAMMIGNIITHSPTIWLLMANAGLVLRRWDDKRKKHTRLEFDCLAA